MSGAQKRKVTLAWNNEVPAKILSSIARDDGWGYKSFDLPLPTTVTSLRLRGDDAGSPLGFSMWTGTAPTRTAPRPLATIDPSVPIGAEVKVIWGEPNGSTRKSNVERYEQLAVRDIVSPRALFGSRPEHLQGRLADSPACHRLTRRAAD